MSKQYSCDLCKKSFNQKIDFTRHQSKKMPCISLSEMQQISQTKEVKTDNKGALISAFKNCLNIMRNEGLTGEKALRNLSYLLILKLIEPHFGREIDIDNYEYDFSHIEDEMVEQHKNKLLEIVRFSNLSRENEDNIPVKMTYLWDDILSRHPTTKKLFLKDKGFDIQYKTTYKKLIDKLSSLDLSHMEYDVLGSAYEEVIQHTMIGKDLGQFFTQPLIKKMMVKLIDPQIHPDGKIDTCGDPTMGTGGFLITYLRYILQQATAKNIAPDWGFIKTEGLYGKEIVPDTYQLAVSNMLIASGHMFENLDIGDSIRDPITRKFDNILANPPFGIKGLKYDDFQSSLKSEYVPIKSDNAVSLFIQAIIYMLKIGGKCAVVLPDGQDLFSKSNATMVAVREYLMKTCDLKEINYLPSGIFDYTPIKTCVFYFVKKREGTDVLKMEIKVSKTQKETGRDYKFSKTHQTTKVKFYDYNPYEDVKNLLVEVPIEKIASNSYSLNYAEYMTDETEEEQYEDGVVVKTLDQIFHITKGTLQSSKNIEGEYEFITASDTNKTHNSFTHDCECVMLVGGAEGSLAKAQYFKGKFIASDLLYVLISKTQNEINYKYAWYYLNFNRKKHLADDTICCGTPKKMISKNRCSNIKIPIPSLERQHGIVSYLDFIYERANKTSNQKIAELKQLNEFCLSNQKIFGENVVKTLGEVCNFDIGGTPSRSKPEYYENGNNLWISVRELNGGYIYDTKEKINDLGVQNSSVKLFVKDTILFSFKLSIGKTAIVGNPLYTNEAIAGILSKNNDLLSNKYLYYYLTINDFSKLGSGIIGGGSLNKKSLATIKISIPSLERQREIVEYCEFNDTLIKHLEKEIENNKQLAHQFITGIVNVHSSSSEPSSELYGSEFSFGEDEEEEEEKEDAVSLVVEEVDTPKTPTELQAELAFLLSSPSFDI